MKTAKTFILLSFILFLLLFTSGCTEQKIRTENVTASIPQTQSTPLNSVEIKDYVDNAASYALKAGKLAAINSFNNKSGPFINGDLYIYALDYSGNVLALPYQPEQVGKNSTGKLDEAGRPATDIEIELVKSGGGYYLTRFPNTSQNPTGGFKINYVRPVDNTYWVGTGINTTEEQLINKTLIKFASGAREYAIANGKEKALKEFNSVNGSFTNGELYIFAYDYNGTLLAWPYRPDLVGQNRFDTTDTMGNYHIRAMVDTAKKGNGIVDYYSVNPSTNTTQLKISYITDVDGKWLLGTGRYI